MDNIEEKIKNLLGARRHQVPSDEYLGSVLPEFHRRVHMRALRRPMMREIVSQWIQRKFFFDFQMDFRMSGAMAAVVLVAGLALVPFYSKPATGTQFLTFKAPITTTVSAQYSLPEAGGLSFAGNVDQQIDHMSLGSVTMATLPNLMEVQVPARYVLTNHPAAYDSAVAF